MSARACPFRGHTERLALLAAAVLIGIDQLLKVIVLNTVALTTTIPVIKIGGREVLNLTYFENTGAAFSILQDKRWFLALFTGLLLAALVVILLLRKIKDPVVVWMVAVIFAGGAGNWIDRIARGFVIDYIDLRIINFAVFNFADICVVCGTILVALRVIVTDLRKEKKTAENGDA